MKNLILLTVLLAISSLGHAEEDTTSVRRLSYEVLFAPNVSYRLSTNSRGEAWHIEDRNNTEVPRLGYSIKFGMIYALNDRWNIGSGITYSSIGFNTKSTQLTWITPDADFPTEIRSSSQYTYLGIPLLAYYKLMENKRWRTELIFGASINVYLGKNVITEIKTNDDWTSYANKGFRYDDINLFGVLGIGESYRVNKRWLVRMNLIFNQAFTTTNSMSRTKEYLNFSGVNIGVNYTLHKK